MTKSDVTTPTVRPREEFAARSCELENVRDESSNPGARYTRALREDLRASSFGFPSSFVIPIVRVICGSKVYHRFDVGCSPLQRISNFAHSCQKRVPAVKSTPLF